MSTAKLLIPLLLTLQPVGSDPLNSPALGRIAPDEFIRAWDIDIFPDGTGLPKGKGNAVAGKKVYEQHCLSCHGKDGRGNTAEELAGAEHDLIDNPPDKTIGSYWPYATTVFDFTRRAMPLNRPGILTDDEVYEVTAYLLFLNGIIKEKQEINEKNLASVVMPNRNGFIQAYTE